MFFLASALQVSARGKSACPRATCERRARCLRVITATGWGFGVSVDGFCAEGRRPRPLMVESIAHFERRFRDGGDMAQRRDLAQMEGSTSRFAAV